MRKFSNFKQIGTRLVLGFGVIIFLVVALTVVNIMSVNHINNNTDELTEQEMKLLMLNEKLSTNMLERTNLLQAYALTGNESYYASFVDGTPESIALEEEALANSSSDLLMTAIEQKTRWGLLTDQFFRLYNEGKETEALRILEEQILPLSIGLIDEFEELVRYREEQILMLSNQISRAGALTLSASSIVSVMIIIIGIVTAIITTRVISGPIRHITERMLKFAKGDLSFEADTITRRDEIGQLNQAVQQAASNMRELVKQIHEVATTVNNHSVALNQTTTEVSEGVEQISYTMQELASGSETQASHASDLSSGMNTFVLAVSNAQQLGETVTSESQAARDLSVNGVDLMEESVGKMRTIDSIVKDSVGKVVHLNNQSREISNIVSVIQDIAEQTNLLALNASIEAARAGEHGQGFAVVADEVRKLAEQVRSSIQEITEITTMIQVESESVKSSLENSYQEVQQGTEMIEETGKTFNSIGRAVINTTNNIQQINEQLTNILMTSQTLSGSVEEVASISEQSAAGIEETSASAEEMTSSMEEISTSSSDLAGLVKQLNQLIGEFTV